MARSQVDGENPAEAECKLLLIFLGHSFLEHHGGVVHEPLKKLAFPEESVPRTEGLTWAAGPLHPSERLTQGTQPSLGQSLQTPISFASAMNLEGQTGSQESTYMLLFNPLHASGQLTKSSPFADEKSEFLKRLRTLSPRK